MKNIVLIIGARPNFMKDFPVYEALKNDFNLTLIHTGQHFDEKMSKVFFEQLKFPHPDIHLTLDKRTKAGDFDDKLYINNEEYLKNKDQVIKDLIEYQGELGQMGEIRDKLKKEFEHLKPDLVIVFGDVTSTLAAGLASKMLNIDIAHVESGLRSGDIRMPEEVNRILTDHITKFYFVTEQSGVDNLNASGITENVYLVGNTMIDTQKKYLQQALNIEYHETLGVKSKEYVLITLHRPSNVDDLNKLKDIFDDLERLSKNNKLVYPIHPRTKKNLKKIGYLEKVESNKNIILQDPLGYLEFTCLMANCKYVVTDSGGLQEESTALDIPCFTLRENTERPSTLIQNHGTNQMIHKISEIELKECKSSMDLWDGKSSIMISSIIKSICEKFCFLIPYCKSTDLEREENMDCCLYFLLKYFPNNNIYIGELTEDLNKESKYKNKNIIHKNIFYKKDGNRFCFNRGFIFNVMYKEIKENYIVFIDNDIIFEDKNCIRNVIQYMKKNNIYVANPCNATLYTRLHDKRKIVDTKNLELIDNICISRLNNRKGHIGGTCTIYNKNYIQNNYEYIGFESWGCEDNIIRYMERNFTDNSIYNNKIVHLYHKTGSFKINQYELDYNKKMTSVFKKNLKKTHFKNINLNNYKDEQYKYCNMINDNKEIKYNLGILTYYHFDNLKLSSKNIGDYVQSLAVINIYRKIVNNYLNTNYNIDEFVEVIKENKLKYFNFVFINRDNSNRQIFENNVYLISNGWFSHKNDDKYDFPYHEKIIPLFISFHLSEKHPGFLTEEAIQYLKKYEPIGCRDYSTMKLLEKFNIKNYFSGWLTLQIDFYEYNKSDKIIYNDIDKDKININKHLELTTAYFVPENYKNCNLETLHLSSVKNLQKACKYLKNFCKCKNITTSNLHACMSCIGLNVPCDFISPSFFLLFGGGGRLGGLCSGRNRLGRPDSLPRHRLIFDNNEIIPRENYIKIKEMQKDIINLFTIKVFSLFFN